MVGVAVQCDRSSTGKATVVKGSVKGMEEPSFCNLSLAVDCTLSLGSTTSRTDIPSRLSRAGSPDQDLDWSLSVRSEREVPTRRASDHDPTGQDLSWGGSCNRSDPDLSPEFYPQVSARGPRVNDDSRRGFKAWPRSSAQSYKDEVNTSKALFSMIDDQSYRNRASRQPWLPTSYLPANKAEQCAEDGDSFVRVCAHCGTSKTPLWRNGPGGPKSLCNACGIRFKKAGRRSAASGTADSEVPPSVEVLKKAKRKLMPQGDEPPYWVFPADAKPRKRSRGNLLHRTSESLLSGSCMTWQPWSSPKCSFRSSPLEDRNVPALDAGSFSSDEEEGAVLLMALSCGMVNVV